MTLISYYDLLDFYVSYGFHNLYVSLFSDLRDFITTCVIFMIIILLILL